MPTTRIIVSLDSAIDRAERVFARWRSLPDFETRERSAALFSLEHAVREWMAVLARFADFDGRPPQVSIGLYSVLDGMICTISDNSDGAPCARRRSRDHETSMLLIQAMTDYATYRRRPGSNVMQFRTDFGSAPDVVAEQPSSPARFVDDLLREHGEVSDAA